ncbi:hypothetical protein FKM82_012440 [Ascaphus truei]
MPLVRGQAVGLPVPMCIRQLVAIPELSLLLFFLGCSMYSYVVLCCAKIPEVQFAIRARTGRTEPRDALLQLQEGRLQDI